LLQPQDLDEEELDDEQLDEEELDDEQLDEEELDDEQLDEEELDDEQLDKDVHDENEGHDAHLNSISGQLHSIGGHSQPIRPGLHLSGGILHFPFLKRQLTLGILKQHCGHFTTSLGLQHLSLHGSLQFFLGQTHLISIDVE
jgi:hypothetical protein